MTQEEKAKAYDKAMNELRDLHDNYNEISRLVDFKQELERIFPELKGSEDERIRKELIKETKGSEERLFETVTNDEFVAWLERQGQTFTKKDVDDAYLKGISDTKNELERQAQKPADTVEQKKLKKAKFKTGDRIIGIVSGMQYYITEICDDYYNTESGCTIMFCAQENFELYKQKPSEWSEEDEALCMQIEGVLSVCRTKNLLSFDLYKKMCDLLKSLKDRVQPQSHWKRSDEQMVALKHAFNDGSIAFADMKILATLYEQLKALHRNS